MTKRKLYRVTFASQDKIYELYAREISQGGMYGFVELEGLLFGEKSSVVVDPGEERLKSEFSDVTRTYIPMHAVLRIDEVNKPGVAKVIAGTDLGSKVTQLPVYTQGPRGPSRGKG
ncbi:MAG: DUF1820 family protein [Nevskiales bacterium]